MQTALAHSVYLLETLIPDLIESGSTMTAADLAESVYHLAHSKVHQQDIGSDFHIAWMQVRQVACNIYDRTCDADGENDLYERAQHCRSYGLPNVSAVEA